MIVPYLALLLLQSGGKQEFDARCASCHGADGRGGQRGPAIVLRGRSDQDLRDLIRKGFPAAGMPGFEIPEPKLGAIVAFARSLGESGEDSTITLELRNRRTVNFADLVEPKTGDCPTYHGRLGGNRHSPLGQINTGNVTSLAPRWMFPIPGAQRLQVTPVVVDGIMYVTTVNEAYALDAR